MLDNAVIVTMRNEAEFDSANFDQPLYKHLKMVNYRLQAFGSYRYTQTIKRQKLVLNDSLMSIGFLLEKYLDGFIIEDGGFLPDRQGPKDLIAMTSIYIFADHNLYIYKRTTYSFLDYLRDIGGLFSSFNAIFNGLVFILNYNGLFQLLTSRLFRIQIEPDDEDGSQPPDGKPGNG